VRSRKKENAFLGFYGRMECMESKKKVRSWKCYWFV
jgi:hypothetical protein